MDDHAKRSDDGANVRSGGGTQRLHVLHGASLLRGEFSHRVRWWRHTEAHFMTVFLRDYSSANLRWLTTELALEDIANFIAYQKSLPQFSNSKIIVIGGSYSATLATWMRLKFPHLVDIAYSSSAPLEAIVDFYREYHPRYYPQQIKAHYL